MPLSLRLNCLCRCCDGLGYEAGMNGKQCGCPEICRSRLRTNVGLRLTAAVVSLQRVYIYQQPRGLVTWLCC